MRPDCARCETFVCRKGRPDLAAPDCPMQGPFPDFEELYAAEETRRLVYEAAKIEAEGYCRWPRVHEVVVLARRMGWRRLGLACAPDTRREAALAARWFLDAGLEVVLPGASVPMEAAAQAVRMAEEEGPRRICRVAEAMRWADSLGMRRLGVSFCVGFRSEARALVSILERNGFETVSLCCKSGAVPKERMGIEDAEKVRPGGPEMICNSVAQGRVLNRAGTDAVLILGQCAGHDAATLAELEVPAVVLVAKDRVYAHNTVAPLYAAEAP